MSFALPARPAKPRRRGVTSVIDFGPDTFGWTGESGVRDLIACAGDYIDYAKIYALNALLLPLETVTNIVRLYQDAGIVAYAGGILFEYAYLKAEVEGMMAHLEKVGIKALEISENYISLQDDERRRFIDRLQKRGFHVIIEFGSKNPEAAFDVDRLGELVADVRAQGVDHLIVEQSEIDMVARSNPGALTDLASRPWFENLLIETDPYAFPKQHAQLLKQFGTDINLANVTAGQALRLEGLRRGIGRAVDYAILAPLMEPARGAAD